MFVGHTLLAFSGVAAAAHYLGYTKRRALALGVFAGAFALIPDVDILYAFLGAFSGFDGVWGTVDAFWESSTVTHRAATHSLVVGGISAVGFYLVARTLISFEYEEESSVLHSLGGAALLGGLTVVVLASSGPVVTATFVVFALAGVFLTAAGVSLNGISGTQLVSLTRRELLAVASAGLLSHPFGDLFTGKPPDLLYPLGQEMLATRITLVPEPTLNLITAFMIELATVWVAVYVFAGLSDKKVTLGLDPKASVGIAYASAVLLIPPPTLSRSYEFVFTAVSTGFVGLTVLPWSNSRSRKAGETSYLGSLVTYARPEYHRRWIAGLTTDDVFSAVVTGVSAVTLAVVGYGVSYVVITLVL